MPDQVVTRFAPSPTGALHVGGARTALFNWAFARKHGGKFLLRIEDTDLARSTEASERSMLEDLKWLGLDWDNEGDVPRQSQHKADGIYDQAIDKLIAADRAYEEDDAIRFRMPDHDITVHDEVLGEVTVKAGQTEDFIIRKGEAGGFMPTFHLAVVIDDAAMGVTHIIRGQEHLNNTPKHIALQQALDLPTPTYAHIPLIFNADGSKMSKRDKAKTARAAAKDANLQPPPPSGEGCSPEDITAFLNKENDDITIATLIAQHLNLTLPEIEVADFRESGYLPETLCTYLALLGWNPGDDVEEQTVKRDYLSANFDLERCGKSNGKFDRDKLAAFSADAIKALPLEVLCDAVWMLNEPTLSLRFANTNDLFFQGFCEAYRERSKTLRDPVKQGAFFFVDDGAITYDFGTKNMKKAMSKGDPNGATLLAKFLPTLEALPKDEFGSAAHDAINTFCEQRELNIGKLAQPIRVAISGSTVTPPIDATLDILGKQSTIARINNCLTAFNNQ